jgi:hypothetical protein
MRYGAYKNIKRGEAGMSRAEMGIGCIREGKASPAFSIASLAMSDAFCIPMQMRIVNYQIYK